jgi:hypothetical protein
VITATDPARLDEAIEQRRAPMEAMLGYAGDLAVVAAIDQEILAEDAHPLFGIGRRDFA